MVVKLTFFTCLACRLNKTPLGNVRNFLRILCWYSYQEINNYVVQRFHSHSQCSRLKAYMALRNSQVRGRTRA